jgi:hypothetical protein
VEHSHAGFGVMVESKKATARSQTRRQETKYLVEINECVKEMNSIRCRMKQLDVDIRRSRSSSRRKLEDVWKIIRRVEATV